MSLDAMDLRLDDLRHPAVIALLQEHLDWMRRTSPPESVHALDPGDLATPDVAFFTLREGDAVLGMGAVKRIDAAHAEIKSMHIVAEARGRGLAQVMLDHLLTQAQALGYRQLSLETGVEDVFAPARALYARAGFAQCPPFEGYWEDPNSYFMTRKL